MLSAQALLRERGHRIHTVMVGGDAYDISPEYARSLPGLVERLGLAEDVTMTGQVPDAGPYIECMDILVNASDCEPFGIVLLEGMARGVAVVAVDSGGPAESSRTAAPACWRARASRRRWPMRWSRCWPRPLCATPSARRAASATPQSSPTRRCASGSLQQLQSLGGDGRRAGRGAPGAPCCTDELAAAPQWVSRGRRRRGCPVTIVAHDIGPVGGMERQLAELALGLRRAGHEVQAIARTCELPADAGVVFRRVRGPSRPFVVAYPWFALVGSLLVWRHRRGVVQATGAIVLNRVDAISVHCCHQVHRASPNRPLPLLRWYVGAVGLIARVCERLCFRSNRAARFVCVSDGVAAEMCEHFPELSDRVVAIHNGVDTGAFAPGTRASEARALRERLGLAPARSVIGPETVGAASERIAGARETVEAPPERLVLAFVGGDWGHKGLRTVIEALAHAPEWHLVVAGRGHVAPYQQLADSRGVGEAVHWLGVVRDMPVIYELADAFVLASGYETFSLVTFEAAASGLPIVATPVNGVCELIEDGRNGFLLAPEARAIAERLRRLAADPALRERLGAAARRSVLAFSWEEMVIKHEALYERLAD